MPPSKSTIFISCRPDICVKIVERLDELPPIEYIEYEITNGGLRLTVYGYPSEIKELKAKLRSLAKLLLSQSSERRGARRYSVIGIAKEIGQTFPIQPLILVLRKKGFAADYDKEKGELVTNAPGDVVRDIAITLAKAAASLRAPLRGTAAKYFVIACYALTGLATEDIVEKSVELGILGEEEGELALKMEWERAVEQFLKYSAHEKNRGDASGGEGD